MAFLKYVIEMMMALFLGYSKTWVIMCCSKVNFDLATAKIIVTEINVIFYYMHIRVKVLSSSFIIIKLIKSIAQTQYIYVLLKRTRNMKIIIRLTNDHLNAC